MNGKLHRFPRAQQQRLSTTARPTNSKKTPSLELVNLLFEEPCLGRLLLNLSELPSGALYIKLPQMVPEVLGLWLKSAGIMFSWIGDECFDRMAQIQEVFCKTAERRR